MNPPNRIMLTICGALWVGGWGFAFYRYPKFLAERNRRFGRSMFATPKYMALLKGIGIVEMILAGVGVLSLFFLNW